jgi:hypothetical protein
MQHTYVGCKPIVHESHVILPYKVQSVLKL